MGKLVDLSQRWSVHTPPWPGYPYPSLRFIKRIPTEGIYAQFIETPLHCGTHMDGPMHAVSGGKDIASIPLDQLYGEAAVVDLRGSLGELDILTHEHITNKIQVKEKDILIINYGWHRYAQDGTEPNEVTYFMKHPGPTRTFAEWCLKMKFKWIGVDCGSADHPMNLPWIRKLRPEIVEAFEAKIGKRYTDVFPLQDSAIMHFFLFPYDVIHAENLGGDIDKLGTRRVKVGAFPWRFVGGESAFCRIVAFEEF